MRPSHGDEHVQWMAPDWTGGQDLGVLGVERLDDSGIGRSNLGDLLRAETVFRSQETREVGFDGVGDVDDELACQLFAVLLHHVENGRIRNRQDDNVPDRSGAKRSGRRAGSNLLS
jgi:hypothetical protein